MAALGWEGPVYEISAVSGQHTSALCGDLMSHLEVQAEQLRSDADADAAEQLAQEQMQQEARERITSRRPPVPKPALVPKRASMRTMVS